MDNKPDFSVFVFHPNIFNTACRYADKEGGGGNWVNVAMQLQRSFNFYKTRVNALRVRALLQTENSNSLTKLYLSSYPQMEQSGWIWRDLQFWLNKPNLNRTIKLETQFLLCRFHRVNELIESYRYEFLPFFFFCVYVVYSSVLQAFSSSWWSTLETFFFLLFLKSKKRRGFEKYV